MSKQEATRLADALDTWEHLLDEERDAISALLRRWPDAGEPVAWLYTRKSDGHMAAVTKRMDAALKGADEWTETPLYTAPPADADRIAALEREVEALRKDAERYRWLRAKTSERTDFYSGEESWMVSRAKGGMGENYFGDSIDQVIDAVRGKTT